MTTAGDRLRAWRKRVRSLLFRRAAERELAEEMHWHVEQEVAQNVAGGMSPGDARRAALLAFGGTDRFAESVRDVRDFGWLESLRQDLGHAVRSYRRTPGLALIIVLTLALGIGGATAIFGVVDTVLLRPLPYPHADRLVQIWETTSEGDDFSVADANFLDFAAQNRTFDAIAAYRLDAGIVQGDVNAERLDVLSASHSLFDVLGVEVARGRPFDAREDAPDAANDVALLSHAYWQRAFGGRDFTPNRTLRVDGRTYTIVGVLSESATFLGADLWRPLGADPSAPRDDHWLQLIGRVADGRALATAEADLQRIALRFGEEEPAVAGWSVRIEPLMNAVVGEDVRTAGLMLLACVLFLLLMACVNVTNLLLGRATTRQTDLGVRLALGIGRARLLRQLVAESAVLTITSALLGIAAAYISLDALRAARPAFLPRVDEIIVDWRVLLFALLVTCLTTIVVSLLPALQSVRTDVHSALKQSARSGATRGQLRLRDSLVIAQVALAAMLLVGGGLMLRSMLRITSVDPGFQTEHVWSVPLQVNPDHFPEYWQIAAFYHETEAALRAIPGVVAAGATAVTPFGGMNFINDVTPEERAAESSAGFMQAAWRVVTPGWFDAANVTLLRGRYFDHTDVVENDEHVVVVTESFARQMWGDADAIGRRLYWGGTTGRLRTVVGVIQDIRDFELAATPGPVMFLSTRQLIWPNLTMIVRTAGPIAGIESRIRETVRSIDAGIPVPIVQPLEEHRAGQLAQPRLQTTIVTAFAAIALLLAIVGLYGVLSFNVAQRRREIGVRMALGARAHEIRHAFVRRGLLLAALGLAAGLAGAALLSRLIAGVLYDTAPLDALTFALVAVLFAGVATVATFLPARRAASVEPLHALRSE